MFSLIKNVTPSKYWVHPLPGITLHTRQARGSQGQLVLLSTNTQQHTSHHIRHQQLSPPRSNSQMLEGRWFIHGMVEP